MDFREGLSNNSVWTLPFEMTPLTSLVCSIPIQDQSFGSLEMLTGRSLEGGLNGHPVFRVPQAHSRCSYVLRLLQGGVSHPEFEALGMGLGKSMGTSQGGDESKSG